LLLDAEDYARLFRSANGNDTASSPFALAYFVNVRALGQIPWEATIGLSALRSLELRVIPLQGAELVIPERYLFVPTPEEWLRAFHQAACVVTNSYHGALFAVIMKKPFLVCLQSGTTAAENCRFTSVLEPLGLASRILPSEEWSTMGSAELADRMHRPIDWDSAYSNLERLRNASKLYLTQSLEAGSTP
jgi:hypothetical protein